MILISRYQPLLEYLRCNEEARVTLTFSEIEALLGVRLPNSAHTQRNWWSNRTHSSPQSAAWTKAGYRIVELDMEQERVTFYKPDVQMLFGGEVIQWDGALIKALRYHLKINQTELSRMLDVRQQTISEWETGIYKPKWAKCRQLTEIAKQRRISPGADGSPTKDQAPESDAQDR